MKISQPFTEEEFKHIYSRVPRLCIEVLIKTDQGILMTLRDIAPYKNFWHFPGGTVRYRETIEEAVKRVAKEELNIEVEVGNLIGYMEYPSDAKLRGWGWPIALQFFCIPDLLDFKLDRQAREFKFFGKTEEIPPNTVEEHKRILKELLT